MGEKTEEARAGVGVMQMKLFRAATTHETGRLEYRINEWLSEQSDIVIKDTTCVWANPGNPSSESVIVTVWYEASKSK